MFKVGDKVKLKPGQNFHFTIGPGEVKEITSLSPDGNFVRFNGATTRIDSVTVELVSSGNPNLSSNSISGNVVGQQPQQCAPKFKPGDKVRYTGTNPTLMGRSYEVKSYDAGSNLLYLTDGTIFFGSDFVLDNPTTNPNYVTNNSIGPSYSFTVPKDYSIGNIIYTPPSSKKCECGKEKHNFASHSSWCDLYEKH